MATTILKKLWSECLMTLLLRNMFISLLLSLEKGQGEKLLFRVTSGTARTNTQHHLWTMNIVKTALTRNANQGLSDDESFFSSIEHCLLFCVKGYFFKGEKRLYPRKELSTTVSLYRLYWVFFKSWNKWFVSSIYFFIFEWIVQYIFGWVAVEVIFLMN